ncbi:HAD hydrolase family protein [Candidatus Bathyarchaeota archaeon]|nr:HAD hydrolase family protein [Candidatus Bathyarchaeota archaeon]
MKKVFISDCEGPISKNDNAFELTTHYVPHGDHLFTVVSKYDDVLADILKKPGYKAGNTLKLILPFLKAYGVTDRRMRLFSAKTLVLMPNVKETLKFVRKTAQAFIVSTSYEHYIKSLCHVIKFPYENTYCTRVKIDEHQLSQMEKERLRRLAEEIAGMPVIEIPHGAKSIKDFPEMYQRTIRRLDEIFWNEIPKMEIGKILSEVNPVGGQEKAEAVKCITERLGMRLADVVYVGDSITDVEAFKTVRRGGGLTIAFNGNEYAVREAEIAVMAEKTLVTAVLAEVFSRFGKKSVIELANAWNFNILKTLKINTELKSRFLEAYGNRLPQVEVIKPENMERIIRESTVFRKNVRGEAVGKLG